MNELKNSDIKETKKPEVDNFKNIKPQSDITVKEARDYFYNEFRESDTSNEIQGGSYREVFKEGEGENYEVHHMPANDINGLEFKDGPAIKMEKADHRQTASCGNSREAREYRNSQQELIESGDFRGAIQMDIDDIKEKFGNKYDDAISQMLNYVDKLESEGKI